MLAVINRQKIWLHPFSNMSTKVLAKAADVVI